MGVVIQHLPIDVAGDIENRLLGDPAPQFGREADTSV
jgi:hypothetical protein